MDQNTTDTTDDVEARVVLQGGPLDGDEYRTSKPLLPMLFFMDRNQVPVTYERATERIFGPKAPLRYVVDDEGRHVYRPHPPLLEDALVPQP